MLLLVHHNLQRRWLVTEWSGARRGRVTRVNISLITETSLSMWQDLRMTHTLQNPHHPDSTHRGRSTMPSDHRLRHSDSLRQLRFRLVYTSVLLDVMTTNKFQVEWITLILPSTRRPPLGFYLPAIVESITDERIIEPALENRKSCRMINRTVKSPIRTISACPGVPTSYSSLEVQPTIETDGAVAIQRTHL